MSGSDLLTGVIVRHAGSVALCALRIGPAAFLCPALGGPSAPVTVRLGVVLSLSATAHAAVMTWPEPSTPWELGALAARELGLGLLIGIASAWPFEAARIGGRFIDLFRGSSAESVLPWMGGQDSASGSLCHQLLLSLGATTGFAGSIAANIVESFRWVAVGAAPSGWPSPAELSGLAMSALSAGLAIGMPVAAASLAVDACLAFASRAAPQLRLQDVGSPARLLGGAATFFFALPWMCDRIAAGVGKIDMTFRTLLGAL